MLYTSNLVNLLLGCSIIIHFSPLLLFMSYSYIMVSCIILLLLKLIIVLIQYQISPDICFNFLYYPSVLPFIDLAIFIFCIEQGYSKSTINVGARFSESEVDAVSQRFKSEDFPETWYSQFFENNRANKPYRLMFGDRESEKRTPEQMSNYLRVLENHKRRRAAFKDNASNLRSNSVMVESTAVDDMQLFPETMFTLNCVPDSAVLQTSRLENIQKVQFNGVLDNLPQIMTKSPVNNPIMIERLGIRPEYLNMEQGLESHGRNGYPGNRKLLSEDQASQMAQKVVARLLTNIGFESSLDSTLEILAQFLSCHISKLGRILKLLADSYRQQCSATELIKMFLQQTAGYRLVVYSSLECLNCLYLFDVC